MTRAPEGERAWVARRTLPQTGRFSLGVDFPVRWEVDPAAPDSLRASGSVTRESMRVADDLEGRLSLDLRGQASVLADGRVRESTIELRFALTVADGMSVVWALRASGQPAMERVAGVDLMEQLLAAAGKYRLRVYFLGAKREVVTTLVEQSRARHPGLEIAGFRDGYFGPEDHAGIVEEIRASGGDLRMAVLNETVHNIFEILGFNHLYRTFPSEAEAVESFREGGQAGS